MLSKKAQTSTEYLIIIAIVIIIALVVVAVMGGVPTLGAGSGAKIGLAYWKTSPIGIQAVKMTAGTGGDDNIVVKNNMETTIEIKDMWVNNIEVTGDANITLAPGGTRTLNASIGSGTAGDAYSYSVNATYDDKENDLTGLLFTADEKLKGKFQ